MIGIALEGRAPGTYFAESVTTGMTAIVGDGRATTNITEKKGGTNGQSNETIWEGYRGTEYVKGGHTYRFFIEGNYEIVEQSLNGTNHRNTFRVLTAQSYVATTYLTQNIYPLPKVTTTQYGNSVNTSQITTKTTISADQSWTTTLSTTRTDSPPAIVIQEGDIHLWRKDMTYLLNQGPVYRIDYAITGWTEYRYADGDIGVYYSRDRMPFTAGETFTNETSWTSADQEPYGVEITELQEFLDYDENGDEQRETYEDTIGVIFCPQSMDLGLHKNHIDYRVSVSYNTIPVPKAGWGSSEESTRPLTLYIAAIPYVYTTFPASAEGTFSTQKSASGSWTRLVEGKPSTFTTQYTSYEYSGHSSPFFNVIPLSTSYPWRGPNAYLVATTQTGWISPKEGFHTKPPSKEVLNNNSAFSVGNARPGVNVVVPLAAVTPLFPRIAKTYFAGMGLVQYGTELGATAASSAAFTFTEAGGGSSISPDVYKLYNGTSTETSTLVFQGDPESYGGSNYGSHIGGDKDRTVTWTLVAEGAGDIVVYEGSTSQIVRMSGPGTKTFGGSKGSFLQFIPDNFYGTDFEFFNNLADHGDVVLALPLYDYQVG